MFGLRHRRQVLKTVVGGITIEVMDILRDDAQEGLYHKSGYRPAHAGYLDPNDCSVTGLAILVRP